VSTRRAEYLTAPKGFCRGCGKPVPKGRRSWCSKACVDAGWLKLSPAVARARVHQRDKGVCGQCGFDAEKAERILRRLQSTAYSRRHAGDDMTYRQAFLWLVNVWAPRKRPRLYGWPVPHLWEADHELPVVEGGGGCELDNYRTLCISCHRGETRTLARRRAKQRREAAMPLLIETVR